jgi:hypothetical protein
MSPEDISQFLFHFVTVEAGDDWVQERYDDTIQYVVTNVEQHGLSFWQMDVEKDGAAIGLITTVWSEV